MARAIIGCIVGYLVMAIFVFGGLTAAWMILGSEGSMVENSWEVSRTWLILSFAVGFVAAVIGGMVCAAIAKAGSKAPMALALVVLILGLVMAVPVLIASPEDQPSSRAGDVTMTEAMTNAQQPKLAAVLNPLVGAVGVVVGAGLVRKKPRASA